MLAHSRAAQSSENREARFTPLAMLLFTRATTLDAGKPFRLTTPQHLYDRRILMKWQTPQAIDMRFGFEVTMYIANR
jgi:pyrroloquinoline quinone biosynthesis protein A